MIDRLAMDAHFHGHDGALLLAEYSFAEITYDLSVFMASQVSKVTPAIMMLANVGDGMQVHHY